MTNGRRATRHAMRLAVLGSASLLLAGLASPEARCADPAVVFVADLRPAGVPAERAAEAVAVLRAALARVPGVVVVDPAALAPVLPALGPSAEVCGSAACAEDLARAADAGWVVTGEVRAAAGGALTGRVAVVDLAGGRRTGEAQRTWGPGQQAQALADLARDLTAKVLGR